MPKINPNTFENAELLEHIQQRANYTFTSAECLAQAFIHSSYAAEHPEQGGDNQRLEFLGDAVLQIILSDLLYRHFPDQQEGILTRLRSLLANEQANESYTRKLGLDAALRLGRGESLNGGRENPSILGDLFEAFLGALYLDGGMEPATRLVHQLLPNLDDCIIKLKYEENPKGALQQLCQARWHQNACYRIVDQTGPVHAPTYQVRVSVCGRVLAYGAGHSHKEAERQAALRALYALEEKEAAPPEAPAPEAATTKPAKTMTSSSKLILGLDFDGVICDSASETAAAAYRAAHTLWPDQFPGTHIPAELTEAFRQARPYLETGFQAIPMLKKLVEGCAPNDFAHNFSEHIQEVMERSRLDKPTLVKLFGQTRDQWLQEDPHGWLASHGIYPGTVDALKTALQKHVVYILTTKQERFVSAILAEHGVDFPAEAIYGLDRKLSKETVLATLCGTRKTNVHFVEDRLETLERVRQIPALNRVKLHYADWGYGLPDDLKRIAADTRIHHLTLPDFCELLA